MAWIEVTREDTAEGRLKEAYDRITRALGRVIPFYHVYSVNPRLLHAHLDFYGAAGAPSTLSKLRKENITAAVSATNGCEHCVRLHGEFLRKLTVDEGVVRALMTDPERAPLAGADRAIVNYALKLTRDPKAMRCGDVEALRAAGLPDAEIFEVALLTAYFNYTNRVAGGLGVEPELA